MDQTDLYKVFGAGSAAGKALFNLYRKKIDVPVPKPKQKSHEQLMAEAEAAKPKAKPKPAIRVPKFRPRSEPLPATVFIPKRKPLEQIRRETNDFQPEAFRPTPGKFRNSDKEKQKLQDAFESAGAKKAAAVPGSAAAVSAAAAERDAKSELIDMLVQEIDERQQFLEEMAALGQREQYEAQIKGEISIRVAQLRKLETQQ
eukprot:EC726699.1.p1 GENE.EC726699.1~~EC726699.1.p1  ORF type:complete len:221 (+),score=38.79 EC726699.1:62-664(+)